MMSEHNVNTPKMNITDNTEFQNQTNENVNNGESTAVSSSANLNLV
jgi:hypothetical protein